MIKAYDVATIRALEAQAIEEVGADALMQRAAGGLAAIAIRELIKVSGGVYGRRVLVLVGPGNNGGDALFAAARLARRGASVTAVRCLGKPHQRGLAALHAAGGRLLELDRSRAGRRRSAGHRRGRRPGAGRCPGHRWPARAAR